MGARGRKAVADNLVVVEGKFGHRLEPPAELTADQAAIWSETVASEAHDYFGTAALRALLKDYCRHRADADRMSVAIDSFKSEWLKNAEGIKRFEALSRVRASETKAAADKATKLRLTNQSRYTPHAAATAAKNTAKGKMPWEFDGEED